MLQKFIHINIYIIQFQFLANNLINFEVLQADNSRNIVSKYCKKLIKAEVIKIIIFPSNMID